MKTLGLFALVLLALFVTLGSSQAADTKAEDLAAQVRASNAQCLRCHSEDGLASPVALPVEQTFERASVEPFLIDQNNFHGSVHGAMECRACHTPASADYPHPKTLAEQISPCEECHAVKVLRTEMQFDESVHAADGLADFTCTTCHNPHTLINAKVAPSVRALVDQDNAMCLSCHGADGATRFASFAAPATPHPDLGHIHDWLPNQPAHWAKVRCVECHTPLAKNLSHEIVNAEKAEKNCVACHSQTTVLRDRLYRHLVKEEREQAGFINSIIVNDAYIIGATRNAWVDKGLGWLLALTLLGVLAHAMARIVGWAIRRIWRKSP